MRSCVPLAVALLGTLAAGCAGASPSVIGSAADSTPGPSPIPTTHGPVPVTLHRFPAGLALIGLDTSVKQLTVEVKVGGLAPGTTHAVQVMKGGCNQPATLLHALEPMVAGADTVADVRTTLDGAAETAIPATGWSLVVDRGATAASGPLMCGDLLNEAGQTVISIGIEAFVPPGGPDPRAAGTVRLRVVGGQLQVVIDAAGLTAGSVHAADLRKGSCESEGVVLHPLATLTADATGHATSTTLVPGIATIPLGGWFIALSTPPALDPVLCGNVGS